MSLIFLNVCKGAKTDSQVEIMVITSLKIAKDISEQIFGKWQMIMVTDRDFSNKDEVIICL